MAENEQPVRSEENLSVVSQRPEEATSSSPSVKVTGWGSLVTLGSKDNSDEGKSLFGLGLRAKGQENGNLGCLGEVLLKIGEKPGSSWSETWS